MRLRLAGAAVFVCALALTGTAAQAKHGHKSPRHDSQTASTCVETNSGHRICAGGEARPTDHARVVARHLVRVVHLAGVGIITSLKTGAIARVAGRYASAFQAYLNDVEAAGGRITFMGGIRPGPCAIPWSKHPCGMALDLCQYRRGVVDHACRLPPERQLAAIAARHGLVEGGVWCHGDRGHAEIRTDRQAESCGRNLYAAVAKFKRHMASR